MSRDVTDDFPNVDWSTLYHDGGLVPGAVRERSWVLSDRVLTVRTRAAATNVTVEFGRGWDGQMNQCTVPLAQVHTHTYFLCPECGARRKMLYIVGQRLACRVCHKLRHPSEGVDEITRNLQGAERIRRALGWTDGAPQAKPKGMSWKKFLQLVAQHRRYEDTAARLLANAMRS